MKRSPLIAVALIAAACHEVNRRYCQGLGDESQEPWELAEEEQRKSVVEGVKAILDGTITGPSDSFEQYDQLPPELQHKATLFFETVVNLSTEIVDG